MGRSLIDRWSFTGKSQGFFPVVDKSLADYALSKADHSSTGGAMIALLIPNDVSNSIYIRDGLEPGEHHITLFFLTNDASTLSQADRDQISRIVEKVAGKYATFIGVLSDEYRTFPPSVNSGGMVPWWRKPIIFQLEEFRADMAAELDKVGFDYGRKGEEWQPHVTITYLPPNKKPPMGLDLKTEFITINNVVFRCAGKDVVHGLLDRPTN